MGLVDALLGGDMVRLKQPAADWKEAVHLGIGCLVDAGKANWGYCDAIIRSVAKNGPYFILMPGVALPHARPEEGALGTGFSLVTLKEPVDFGSPENDPISILLSFCALDAASQVEESLAQAVTLFEDDRIVAELMEAESLKQIEKILRAVEALTE